MLEFASSHNQAKVAESEGRMANYQEDANFARAEAQYASEEANRKTALADAIASQSAAAAGRGVSSFSRSPLAAMRENSRRSSIESQRAKEQLAFERYGSDTAKRASSYTSKQKASAIKTRGTMSLLKKAEQVVAQGAIK